MEGQPDGSPLLCYTMPIMGPWNVAQSSLGLILRFPGQRSGECARVGVGVPLKEQLCWGSFPQPPWSLWTLPRCFLTASASLQLCKSTHQHSSRWHLPGPLQPVLYILKSYSSFRAHFKISLHCKDIVYLSTALFLAIHLPV